MRPAACLPAALVAAATTLLGASPARAAGGPTLSVQAGYAGVPLAQGLWVPVTVTVRGGDAGAEGTLRITAPAADGGEALTDELPVDVPPDQAREVTVAVQSVAGTVVAEVRDASGSRLAAGQAPLAAGNQGHEVVALVTAAGTLDDAAGTYVLGGQTQLVDAVHLGVAGLPDTVAMLRSFDEVVVAGAATGGLSAAQREALSGYVAGGGGLLLTGGDAASQVVEAIPAALLPATPGRVTSAPLPAALVALCGTPSPAPLAAPVDQSALALGEDARATVVDTTGAPIVATRQVGLGRVVMAAVDPAAAPLSGWSQQACLVRELVAAALPGREAEVAMEPTAARGAHGGTTGQVPSRTTLPPALAQAAAAMVSVVPPSAALLAVALGGYALVAGPLAALLPRRRRRRPLLWIALPLLAAVVGAAAWTTGLGVAGVEASRSQLRILDLGGGTTSVDAVAALSLPRGGGASLPLPDSAVATGLGAPAGTATRRGGELDVDGAAAGSVARFHVEQQAGAPPGRGVVQSLRWADDSHLTGTVANRLGVALDGATLLGSDGSTVAVGDVPDGATARVTVVAETALGGYGPTGADCTSPACLQPGATGRLLSALDAWVQARHPGMAALFALAAGPLLPADGPALDAVVIPLIPPEAAGAPLVVRGLAAQGFHSEGVVTGASVTLRDGNFALLDVAVPASAPAVQITPLSGSCWTLGCVDYRLVPSASPLPPRILYDWLDPASGTWRPLPFVADAAGHLLARLPGARLRGADLVLRVRAQNIATSLGAPDIRVAGGTG